MSTTARQVNGIVFREIRKLRDGAGRCVECKRRQPNGPRPCPHSALIDGNMNQQAGSGLKAPDYREIVGHTAREAEAVAGVSGQNLFYIVDEASGVPDVIYEAIEGNRAGGHCRLLLISNPTRTQGTFFEAFHSRADLWRTIHISSEDSPNVKVGRIVVKGLATKDWIDEKRIEHGEDSPFYKVRVLGVFVVNEEGRCISLHAITEAQERWYDAKEEGDLQIGLDPAGPGLAGDETAMAIRRGNKILEVLTWRGINEDAIYAHLMGILQIRARGNERPLVVIDREGPVGATVYGSLRARAKTFDVAGVKASDRAFRQQAIYDRVRDELWANLAAWLRDGGAIPNDGKLEQELHAPEWIGQVTGRLKATSKDDLRAVLGRSPDRADALALAVWRPGSVVSADEDEGPAMRS
jgi:hypothetical protein